MELGLPDGGVAAGGLVGEPPVGAVAVGLGAVATVMVTCEPFFALLFAVGAWASTVPTGSLADTWVITLYWNPALYRLLLACACDRPTTFGTVTKPLEIVMATLEPASTVTPAAGS